MKIILQFPDSMKGTLGMDDRGTKLNVEFSNNMVSRIFENMLKEEIEGSIWEADIIHNDMGTMVFSITDFISK